MSYVRSHGRARRALPLLLVLLAALFACASAGAATNPLAPTSPTTSPVSPSSPFLAPALSPLNLAPADVPVGQGTPNVAGTPAQGLVLTASETFIPNGFPVYQWLSSATPLDSTSWTPIAGATATSYTPQYSDEGNSLEVEVYAANASGTGPTVTSGPTAAVAKSLPQNAVPPTMTGTTQRTYTLQTTSGTWKGPGLSYSYQWQRCFLATSLLDACSVTDSGDWSAVSGQTATTYTLTQADEGYLVRVAVSASNADGLVTADSTPTSAIISPYPPANTVPPAISGTPARGVTLYGTTGTWTGPSLSYSYQWQRNAGEGYVNIPGATTPTYTPVVADEGTALRFVVSASNVDPPAIAAASLSTSLVVASNPTPTTPPSIAAETPTRGLALSANPGTYAGVGNIVSGQWKESSDGKTWTSISGATGDSYTPQVSDETDQLLFEVTVTNPDTVANPSETLVKDTPATAAVVPSWPTTTTAPSISGATPPLVRGTTLSANPGTYAGIGTTTSYAWQESSDSGVTWTNIKSATGLSYTTVHTDIGELIRFTVTVSNPDETVPVSTAATTAVQANAPTTITAPTLSGTPQRGSILSLSEGAFTGTGNAIAVQWQTSPDGTNWTSLKNATGTAYLLGVGDESTSLRVQETVTDIDTDTPLVVDSNVVAVAAAAPPTNSVAPLVSGSVLRGGTLTTTQGTWTGLANSYAYQWEYCSATGAPPYQPIAGATSNSYVVAFADEGHYICAQVTATNADLPAGLAVPSGQFGPAQNSLPHNTLLPGVSGSALRGAVVTATTGVWSGAGNTYVMQWQNSPDGTNWANITGATAGSYSPVTADVGKRLRMQVTATNPDGTTSITSAATTVVKTQAPVIVTLPVISGTAARGQALTSTPGTWTGAGNVYTYQWMDCDAFGLNCTNISGATSSTYTVVRADENLQPLRAGDRHEP